MNACQLHIIIGCTNGEIRLQGGPSENEGLLQICFFNTWGTVCDDNIRLNSAQVVCRQLGYNVAGSTLLFNYESDSGPIWLDEVRCSGNETELMDCPSNGIGDHNCDHSEDIGVRCVGK